MEQRERFRGGSYNYSFEFSLRSMDQSWNSKCHICKMVTKRVFVTLKWHGIIQENLHTLQAGKTCGNFYDIFSARTLREGKEKSFNLWIHMTLGRVRTQCSDVSHFVAKMVKQ